MHPLPPSLPALKKTGLKRSLQKKWALALPVLILLGIAFWLRIYRLEDYPIQVNHDELSNFYDAYSIVETGADRWGLKYPLILRAFGDKDYRPPLYTWLSAAAIKTFGYSIFAGRLPSVILGLCSLMLLYLTAKKIGSPLFAYLALLLACFSPWHLLFSRLGVESAVLTAFFIILALYLWLQAKAKQYPLPTVLVLGLVTGLGTSTYQAGKLIFFLLALTLLADIFISCGRSYKKALVFGLCCLVGAAPQLYIAWMMPERFLAKADEAMVPFSFTFYYFNTLLRNFFSNLSPDFLFFSFSHFNNESIGRLLPVELPFFYLGLFHLKSSFKSPRVFSPFYFYLLIFIIILPCALTDANPHALRISGLIVLLPMVSAAGIVWMRNQIKSLWWKKAFLVAAVGLVVANSLFFVREYVGSEEFRHDHQHHHLALMSARLNHYKDNYARIYIGDMSMLTPLYITHYCQIKPRDFQRATKVMRKVGFDHFTRLDKYYFLSQAEIEKQVAAFPRKSLIVLQQRQVKYKLIDSLQVYNRKQIFFYESR